MVQHESAQAEELCSQAFPRISYTNTMIIRHILSIACFSAAICPFLAVSATPIVDASDPEVRREIEDFFGPGASGAFVAENAMVASLSVHATLAGLEILRQGGNAFDAAVAVQLALAVVEPYGSGLGGGLFAVFYDADSGQVAALDGREETPLGFDLASFRRADGSLLPFHQQITGGRSVGVPGTLAACSRLLEDYGTLSLAEVAQPAIRLAREGFLLPATFVANLQQHWARLLHDPNAVALFSRADGNPLQKGDRFRNPDFALTLEHLIEHGWEDFYHGALAQEIVDTVRNDARWPGQLALEDLKRYRAVFREPVRFRFGDYECFGMSPPSSGGIALGQMLGMLDTFDSNGLSPQDPIWIQRMVEVQNLAFADRNRWVGDADFFDVPAQELLAPEYLQARAAAIASERALATPLKPGTPMQGTSQVHFHGAESNEATTHFTIIDQDRNMVAVTSTIEQHFGAAIVVPNRGMLLNNQLTDLSLGSSEGNADGLPNRPDGSLRPRRTALSDAEAASEGTIRPRSSMTPTLVFRQGEPWLALGSPGGSRIIGAVFNVVTNLLVHDMELQAAVNYPRIIARNGPVELEGPHYHNSQLTEMLEARGYKVINAQVAGAVQAILIDANNRLRGAADPRREGSALGF
jgi:gamma-glutamyltranspeptidase/glutathione hydrolase